jgi:hypothetical protein
VSRSCPTSARLSSCAPRAAPPAHLAVGAAPNCGSKLRPVNVIQGPASTAVCLVRRIRRRGRASSVGRDRRRPEVRRERCRGAQGAS